MAVITPASGDGSVEATVAAPAEAEAVFFNIATGGVSTAKIAADAVTNAKLANVNTATFKGRTTAGAGDPEDLTATQATALLNAFTGDTGAGGVKGLVPAPAAGDAAANKYLKADGTWATTAETAQDDVGGILVDTSRIDLTYDDATPQITADIVADSVSNTYLANMDQSTIKGRAAGAGTGDPTDLTATQATAILNAVVGDAGAGGTKGLVPAPAAGDAAANKFLHADGTFTALDEIVQDSIGGILTDTARIDLTYTDATPEITADLVADSVSNTYLSNMAQDTIKGRATGAGTGDPTDLTAAQAVAIISTSLPMRVISAAVVNETLSAAVISTTRTVFGSTVTIPANTLIAGVRYKLLLYFLHTSANSVTSEISLCKDDAAGTTLYSSGFLQVGSTTGLPGIVEIDIVGTAAAGAAVNVYTFQLARNNHNTQNPGGHTSQPVALATNADLVLAPCGDFSSNTAGHSIEWVGYTFLKVAA